ncbi:hypothetical protein [Roseovarius sp.]|uniref:hypothetical protein n=1 Tax=Roseovarius sp. TaxID=1486281 RepID=UPI003D0C6E56
MTTQYSKPKMNKVEQNPLSELAALRLAISPDGEDFEVACQLRFSTGEVSVSGREYTVGISEARLQLGLEGCETALGCDYGNSELAIVEEEKSVTTQAGASGAVGGALSKDGIAIPSVAANAETGKVYNYTISGRKTLLPMTALPGNAWRIKVASTKPGEQPVLDGTAIDGERLCRLLRKEGGNRLSLAAELQVRRSKITVTPAKGNKVGKLFNLTRNKDAVVAKILEKVIRREASTIPQGEKENAVVAARTELTEE